MIGKCNGGIDFRVAGTAAIAAPTGDAGAGATTAEEAATTGADGAVEVAPFTKGVATLEDTAGEAADVAEPDAVEGVPVD